MSALPDRIDPRRWADQLRECAGQLPEGQLARLREAGAIALAPVSVTLRFWRDGDGRLRVGGEACAEVQMDCQRCLEPMRVMLEIVVSAAVVASDEQARHLPEELDPWLLEEDALDVVKMIEDEIILALPVIPRHAPGECEEPAPTGGGPEEREDRTGPFAGLAVLKRDN